MNQLLKRALAAALTGWLAAQSAWPAAGSGTARPELPPDSAILQIRVLEGEGGVSTAGSRSSRGIVAQVTDETGRPVEGAAVSVRLPDDGATGTFSSGLKTEIAVTGHDGRAAFYGIRWNRVAGPLQIRITAVKGEARAGTIISHYISEPSSERQTSGKQPGVEKGRGSRSKWLILGLIVAGAGGGAALGLSRSGSGSGSGPGGALPPAGSTAPPVVGAPEIGIGRP